ncbi:hypothetical protein LTR36_002936 [Oleoguttula mirabilis]|uniref:Serine aminopeptidase S33 domain-containing protein n=1 Tax=Oleoguttula mirabilis TaxID=1507867 RepID=A0AAV9JK89_9PEZI|nr:hypothetical protein LTR36_002936 [Oleoguttula mirabilis]
MADMSTLEGSFTTPDGHELYTKTWKPTSALKARIVLIHGFSDHCNNFEPLSTLLAQQGIAVYSFDQRGWGQSVHTPAEKGRSGPTGQVMDDITAFIEHVLSASEGSDTPLFLMGHSMGGAQVLLYASRYGPAEVISKIRGFLVEAPFVALHPDSKPWKITVVLGRLAGKLLPHMHMVNKLDPKKLCRDPDVCKALENDPLCHDTGTLEGLAGMLDRASLLETGSVVLGEGRGEGGKTRLWVGHGTADGVCDYYACRKWYENAQVKDKEMQVYEGWYHVLHKELGEDKVRFAQDVAKWVLARCEGDGVGQTEGADVVEERARL